ncbi:MAG: O-antigen ligase family protein [Desulfovibrionaceae bacterium]|nr:O-antigen ligase family protein [Desulfovibrionaceae bacterium]
MIHGRRRIYAYLKQVVLLLTPTILLFPLVGIRDIVPLIILGGIGLCSFFLPEKNRLSGYGWICLAFFLYMLFSGGRHRHMILAFFSGTAIYYALRAKYPAHLNLLPAALLTSLGLALAGLGFGLFGPEKLFLGERLRLFDGHPNGFGYMASAPLIAGLARILDRPKIPAFFSTDSLKGHIRRVLEWLNGKGPALAGSLAAITMLWLSNSRTALAAALAGVTATLFFRLKNRTAILCAVAGLGLFLAVIHLPPTLGLYDSPALARVRQAVNAPWNDPTFKSRRPLWESAWHSAWKSPMLGNGPGSFKRTTHPSFVQEHYEELCAKYGRNIIDNDTVYMLGPHNLFLQTFTERGLIGLGLLLIILVYPLLASLKQGGMGALGPLLVHFLVFSLAEDSLSGTSFSNNVLFSSLGYFACAHPTARIFKQRE